MLILWHCSWSVTVSVQEYWEEVRVVHIKRTLLIRKGLGTRNRNCLYLDAVILPPLLPLPLEILDPHESDLFFCSAYCWTPKFSQSNAPPPKDGEYQSLKIHLPFMLSKPFLAMKPQLFSSSESPALPQPASLPPQSPAGKPAGLPHFLLQLNNPS